jgi:CPA1 family monovalent cation:H+ antiporter
MLGTAAPCDHVRAIDAPADPHTLAGCEECLATGGRWVHLRVCLECGHVGCCDSSPNRHATAHFHSTQHAVMASVEPGETWGWCYPDKLTFEAGYEPRARARADGVR